METDISDEDLAIIQYLKDSGISFRVTSTTDHSTLTNAGNLSRHVAAGTHGRGLAVDVAGPDLLKIFQAFKPVEHELHELIYAGSRYNVKNGEQVRPYAVKDHKTHVHISVDKGKFIKWQGPKQLTRKEIMAAFPNAVDAVSCPTGGTWVVGWDGGVGAYNGAPFLKSYLNLPLEDRQGERRFLSIEARQYDKGWGYRILGDDGSFYDFQP